jgi:very-short-patch-repair endonuclease
MAPLPRVISRSQAFALGLPDHVIDHRLASGHWRRLLPSVYFTRQDVLRRDLLDAALLYVGEGAVFSGAVALHQHGLLRDRPERMLVLAPLTCRRRSRRWVQVRSTKRLPGRVLGQGIALAPVARAVADHALTLNRIDDVRAITSRVIQRRRCTLDDLGKELEDGPRNGSALLREALTDVGYGAWSAREARAARSLRKARLGPFEQNAKVIGPYGETYFVDFLWRELRAALEIDSREFHFDEPEWKQTQIRHRKLETMGYSAVHMPPSEVKNEAQFISDVRLWLAGRAHSVGLTFPATP